MLYESMRRLKPVRQAVSIVRLDVTIGMPEVRVILLLILKEGVRVLEYGKL